MIRKMLIGDIEQVSEIEKECFEDPWSKSEFMYLIDITASLAIVWEISHSDARIVPSPDYRDSGTIVGYGLAVLFDSWLHIANLAVKPSYRRKGIGNSLVSYMLDYSCKKNKKFVVLEVRVHNWVAINLYKKFGFKEDGVKKSYYPDGEDATVMRMKLNT